MTVTSLKIVDLVSMRKFNPGCAWTSARSTRTLISIRTGWSFPLLLKDCTKMALDPLRAASNQAAKAAVTRENLP